MAICSCGLPARCCQPAVAGGIICADLQGELSTHLALQALFIQSSPGHDCHCYKLSPFQAHWGRWHCTSFLRPVCLFTVHIGSGSSPPPVEFSSHHHFYQLSRSWLLGMCHRSCLLQPACCEGFPLPPLWCSGCPALFATCFFVVIAYYLVFFPFFSLGGCRSVQGGYADLAQGSLWEYHVLLSSPCGPCLPKPSGHCRLVVAQEPSWFLHLTWSGDAVRRLQVWRSQSLPLLGDFSCMVYLQCLSKILL
jgi:hypothetical protein